MRNTWYYKRGREDAGFSSQISAPVFPHGINIPIFKVSEFSKLASWVNSKLTRRPTMNHNNNRFRYIFKFQAESAMKINRIISLKGKEWNKKSSDNSMNVADADKDFFFVWKNERYLLNSHESLSKWSSSPEKQQNNSIFSYSYTDPRSVNNRMTIGSQRDLIYCRHCLFCLPSCIVLKKCELFLVFLNQFMIPLST